MRKSQAATGTAAVLVIAPGVVAGLIPWLFTRWRFHEPMYWVGLRAVGAILIVAGVGVLLHAFVRFVTEGHGTPAPVAPTESLVVGGFYRYVRNPMYLAVGAVIVGQGLLLSQPVLLAYAAVFFVVVALFVRFYEEPTLQRQFGSAYERYRDAVPGWLPRRHAWDPKNPTRH